MTSDEKPLKILDPYYPKGWKFVKYRRVDSVPVYGWVTLADMVTK
jgi:hypothetical protein